MRSASAFFISSSKPSEPKTFFGSASFSSSSTSSLLDCHNIRSPRKRSAPTIRHRHALQSRRALRTGAYAKAEPLYQRALAIHEKALGPDHPDTATALNNLAELYRATGAYAQAEPLYQRALAIREKALGPEHPDTATALNNLAELYHATGAYAKAEPLYQRALAIHEKALGPDHPDTATVAQQSRLAVLRHRRLREGRAALWSAPRSSSENNTARFLLSGSEARKRAYLQQRVGNAYAHVSFSLADPTVRAKALGLTGVLQYKGRVLDAMSDSVARLRQSVAPQDRALFDQLAEVAQQFSTLTFRGPGNLSPEAYRQRLDALAREQERLEGELSTRSAAFRQAVTPITLEGVRQALPADAVLVEWFRYEPFDPKAKDEKRRWGAPRYVAYVLKRSGEPVAIDLGAAQPIDALVTEFRTALSNPTHTYFKEVAEALSEKLIKPLQPHLAQSERLLLSPDGALNLVPFAALVDEHGEYLAQRFELTYLTSGRDLLRLAVVAPARGSAVVVADPAYGQSAGGGPPTDTRLQPARSGDLDRSGLVFTPLKGTAAEAKALQALLKLDAQNVLTGANATEARLRQLHGPRLLHVATHGFFLSDREVAAAPSSRWRSARRRPRCPWARIRCCARGWPWRGPTRAARAKATTASSPRPRPRSSISGARNSWCSRPARPGWGKCKRARGSMGCVARWCSPVRRPNSPRCGRWPMRPPRS